MNKAERTEWAQAELNAEGEIVELRARVRELEAELAKCWKDHETLGNDAYAVLARAEKAIAALDVEHQEVIEQKARVAELERYIWNNTRGWPVEIPTPAREREEC